MFYKNGIYAKYFDGAIYLGPVNNERVITVYPEVVIDGKRLKVLYIYPNAFFKDYILEEVYLPCTISKLKPFTFNECLYLSIVHIFGSTIIEENAFYICVSFTGNGKLFLCSHDHQKLNFHSRSGIGSETEVIYE